MAHWKSKVKIRDLHEAYESNEMTLQEVATKLAVRLRANQFADQIEDLIGDLELLVHSDNTYDQFPEESYDDILCGLYDFADANKSIWFE